jgi:hypothetical protein
MKSLKIVLPLLLLSLSPLQQANATIISQGCYDDYRPGTYYPPELLGTICETSATYVLGGTAAIRSMNGNPFMTLNVTGTMNEYTSVTTDTSGYSSGYSLYSLTFNVPGLGTYTLTNNGGWGGTQNSITGSSFTTDSTTMWDIWSDGVNAIAQTLDGDYDGRSGINLYVNGVKTYVADVHLTAVPVPAAFWLFGTGLVGLVGVAKRKDRV